MNLQKVRHVLGISGGKDSAALAIYLKTKYPQLPIDFYTCDTKCELAETVQLVERLRSYLGHISTLQAAKDSPEPTPFDHMLKARGGYLPSPQARWCTIQMKLLEFEKYVGDAPTVSYVGIRGDEDRDGYVSSKPNIQAIFPFRRNIWSIDVIEMVLSNNHLDEFYDFYMNVADEESKIEASKILKKHCGRDFTVQKKLNAILDINVKIFNRAVFEFLKTTPLPVGQLDEFPLVDNDDVLVKADIFRILEESGIGVPAYYNLIDFEVDGKKGQYCRSRSGCFFCFFQQKIEWVWLLEQHPDLFWKASEYEKKGYTWMPHESLKELARPERVRQIKLDYIAKTEKQRKMSKSSLLIDIFSEDE